MMSALRISLTLLVLLTMVFGGLYPLLVFGVAQTVFPDKANGSLLARDKKIVGSALLAQEFTKAKYFWVRPSAVAYNAGGSSASNMNPANPKLVAAVKERAEILQRNNDPGKKIPVELVMASGSGLDPHISPASAEYQLVRVARARGLKESELRALVKKHTRHWLGTAYVNVLQLNIALDTQGNR